MNEKSRIVKPGPGGTLIDEDGKTLTPPAGWVFLPAGDAGVTRKVTSKGRFWRVQIKKGRRLISLGIWAPEETVALAKEEVLKARSSESYKKRRDYDKKRRDEKQSAYETEFCTEVENFLAFHEKYRALQKALAEAVTKHAVPVGSGTVARTALIPVEERAARAVIA